MQVYIEYVIIDNMVINWVIIWLTLMTMHVRKKWWRIALSSLLGTAFSIVFPLIKIKNFFFQLLLKTLIAPLIVWAFCGNVRPKKFLAGVALFFGYTFLAGGVCFAILMLCGGDLKDTINFTYMSDIPLGVIAGALFGAVYFAYKAAAYFTRYKNIAPFLRRVELTIGGQNIELNGMIDSGNMLYHPKSNQPVILAVSAEKFQKILDDSDDGAGDEALMTLDKEYLNSLDEDLLKQFIRLKKPKKNFLRGVKPCGTMKFYTAAGEKDLKLYRAEKLKIYSPDGANIIYDVIIGLVDQKVKGRDIDLLIHPAYS